LQGVSRKIPVIAKRLYISRNTVASDIQHILRNLDAHSRAGAVVRAYQLEIVRQEAEAFGAYRRAMAC